METKYKFLEFSCENKPEYNYMTGAAHQHAKDKTIMLKLLEIIELMRIELENSSTDDMWTSNGEYNEMFKYNYGSWFQDEIKQTLSKTNQMPNEPINRMTMEEDLSCKFYGLTKREYFAAMAMQGELASQSSDIGEYTSYKTLAKNCVEIADALIEELNKRGSE